MNTMWVQTAYINNKFGRMAEREWVYPGNLMEAEARKRAEVNLTTLRNRGVAVYPQYDLQLERR